MSRKARLRIGVSVLVLAMHNGVQAADKHVAPASASGSATTQASGPDQLTVLPVPRKRHTTTAYRDFGESDLVST